MKLFTKDGFIIMMLGAILCGTIIQSNKLNHLAEEMNEVRLDAMYAKMNTKMILDEQWEQNNKL